jgi:ABC-type Fe3+ transport system substrate-binding protein
MRGAMLLSSVLLLLACGPQAGPAPGAGAASPAAPSAASATAPAAPPTADRQQIVEAARAEGTVNATIHTSWSPAGLAQLESAIEREYGVPIKINFTPVGNFPQRTAELLSEVDANTPPSYDLYQSSDATSAMMRRASAVEAVDWAPLLPAGTPPRVIARDGYHLAPYTDHFGLLSDPALPDAEVPRSIKELGDPKWRGKVMLALSPTTYLQWVPTLGREGMLAALRAAMANGALVDTYPNMLTRFAAKEYPLITISGSFYEVALKRGIPARFTPLDFVMITERHLSVPRRAKQPNAAKLLAAVQTGPEGQRIIGEFLGTTNRYYESSLAYQLEQEARAAGFAVYNWDESDVAALALSPEGEELTREIDQILRGG